MNCLFLLIDVVSSEDMGLFMEDKIQISWRVVLSLCEHPNNQV